MAPAVPLTFHQETDGSLSFDTGVLRGRLHAGGRSLGLTLLFMTRREDAMAISAPQEKDGHYSLYFSLFGSGLAKGEVRRAVMRLKVAKSMTEGQAVEACQAFLEAQGRTSQRPVRRVLVVTGQDYPGHPWRQTAPALRSLLEQDQRMVVTVTEDPGMLDSAALAGYDVIVLHFMNWQQPAPGLAARENLTRRISEGTGLVLIHFACGAFQDWPEFRNLAGRVWDPKLTHDPHGLFHVDIADPEHPITQGMPPFDTTDELYSCLTGDRPPIHVIATARSKVDGRDYPMAFMLEYGKGRVFHTVLGHDLKAITNPPVAKLIRRGCAWAAGLELPHD